MGIKTRKLYENRHVLLIRMNQRCLVPTLPFVFHPTRQQQKCRKEEKNQHKQHSILLKLRLHTRALFYGDNGATLTSGMNARFHMNQK